VKKPSWTTPTAKTRVASIPKTEGLPLWHSKWLCYIEMPEAFLWQAGLGGAFQTFMKRFICYEYRNIRQGLK
jgi:hypothetical protein